MTTSVQLFGPIDNFTRTMGFVSPRDTYEVSRVSRSWQNGLVEILGRLHRAAGLAEMEGDEYTCRTYVFLSETMKGVVEDFETYIGKPTEIARVSKFQIEELSKCDSYDSAKRKYQTHEAVIIPKTVKRTTDGKELEIPLSVETAILLLETPLAGEENGPVFNTVWGEVNEQCTASVEESRIWFIRREFPEIVRGMPLLQQLEQFHRDGARLVNLLQILLFCGPKILKTKTCPYGAHYLRTTDMIQLDRDQMTNDGDFGRRHLVIGGYDSSGLSIFGAYDGETTIEKNGAGYYAIPGIREEVPLGQIFRQHS